MDKIQECIWERLCEMSGEDVARSLTNYHGLQLLDKGFYEFLIDEGYIEDELGIFNEDEDEE